jgi:hypothetical protein
LTKAFVYDALIIHMRKVPRQTVIVMTAAAIVTIVMSISAIAMVTIPQTPAYATEDGDCDFDKEQCEEEECESYEFEGREVKHCDY